MIKSCKEIINQAKHLAQTDNSKAFDWDLMTNLLNNIYSRLYNDLVANSNAFIEYFEFTGKEADLPADCNKILSVFYGTQDRPFIISQSSQNNFIPYTYYIENRTIKIVGKQDSRKITVKYSKLPVTLTFPKDDELLNLDGSGSYSFSCYHDCLYWGTSPKYKYSFSEMEQTDVTSYTTQNTSTFLNQTLQKHMGHIYWGTDDVTDYFLVNNELPATMLSDGTHVALKYSNGDLYIMMSDWSKSQINPVLYKGKFYHITDLLGICCDDSEGDYIIVKRPKDDGSGNGIYKISFVPDTVLDYPDSVFFDIIEDKIAIQLQSLQGLDNTALQTKLNDDEMSFYQSLTRSQQGMRIRNDDNRYRRVW